MYQDEVFVRGFGDFAGVIRLLEGVDLVMDGGLLESCEFLEAFLASLSDQRILGDQLFFPFIVYLNR